MKKVLIFSFFLFAFAPCFSQEEESDTLKTLDEVIVKAFEQNRRLRSTTTAVKILNINNADRYNKTSLVSGFNTAAGVRMEERSPGSYRINIRGSSLRSPFGVRNVKVYWNGIPVTDPGGNTYFNQFAWNNFSHIEIFKGPAGSMYGAGTGGLILLHTLSPWQPGISAEYLTGSYNLQNVFTSFRFGKKENMNQLSYAHNQTAGYRVQSRLRRDNFSWISKLKISEKQQFTASVLFTDMYYQTPGALTLAEFTSDPKNARPAAGVLPSAVAAKAGIDQLNFLAGFTHSYEIGTGFSNHTTFYGTLAEIDNPAIRNYERRSEPGFGGRSVFVYEKKNDRSTLQLVGGGEFQHGFFNTVIFNNKDGKPDTLQTNDDITFRDGSFFVQADLALEEKLFFNAGFSVTKTKVVFRRLSRFPVTTQARAYQNEFAPRISAKGIITDKFFLKATISRGFSPPTIAELLPSTGVISTDLDAEFGWNFEMTAGYDLFKRLRLEATGFYFKLNKALVQRRDSSGADFFINAGDIRQNGLELTADYTGSPQRGPVDHYMFSTAYTLNSFHYGSFVRGTNDFSGKTVPSVPSHTFSALADIQFRNGIYSNITYYSASKIFLNDANTESAEAYHLLGCRLGWKKLLNRRFKLNVYGGAENLLDEIYSLGNDINAPANRFYNTAYRRNYYVGFSFQWLKPPKN